MFNFGFNQIEISISAAGEEIAEVFMCRVTSIELNIIVTKRSILTILNIDTSAVLAELIGNTLRRNLKPNGCKTNKTVWLYFCIKILIEL